MKKEYIVTAVLVIVVGAAAFYGGIIYQRKKTVSNFRTGGFAGQFGGPNGTGRQSGGNRQNMMNGRPVMGEIISADAGSLTVKMPDGSSKIVIISDQTKVNKTSEGAKTDLTKGQQVTVIGNANSDGSMTAQTVMVGNSFFMMRNGDNTNTATPAAQK